jgi:hypothetical protein
MLLSSQKSFSANYIFSRDVMFYFILGYDLSAYICIGARPQFQSQ